MNKKYIIVFSISVMLMTTLGIIMLMLMTPQQVSVVDIEDKTYTPITRSNYTYTQTKNITKDSLVKEYVINSEDMAYLERQNAYNPGNTNPFTPATEDTTGGNNNNGGNNGNNNNNNGGTNTNEK
ncbi:MAG: hypothetical protein N2749_00140 [Clostridia bacterium]|nr:hypothetical protein [Clostridia bacterium]